MLKDKCCHDNVPEERELQTDLVGVTSKSLSDTGEVTVATGVLTDAAGDAGDWLSSVTGG